MVPYPALNAHALADERHTRTEFTRERRTHRRGTGTMRSRPLSCTQALAMLQRVQHDGSEDADLLPGRSAIMPVIVIPPSIIPAI